MDLSTQEGTPVNMLSEVFQMAAQVLDTRPARKLMDVIRMRVKSGTCLHCDRKATRRGLCVNCYFAYRRARSGLTKAQAVEMETKAIKAGKILPANFARQIKSPNLFMQV